MDALHEHTTQFFCELQACYGVEEGTMIDLDARAPAYSKGRGGDLRAMAAEM